MARIVATFKIFPTDVNINLSKLKETITESLPREASVYKFEEEPIAFGLVALILHVILPEEEGEMEKIENILRGISQVSELEVMMVRRI